MGKRVTAGPRKAFGITGGPFDGTKATLRSNIQNTLFFKAKGMKGRYVRDTPSRMVWEEAA